MQNENRICIAVCDDNPQELELTARLVREQLAEPCALQLYGSGQALLEAVEQGARFSLLLLDVLLEGEDGITLASRLRAMGMDADLVFISVNRELALRGYEVSALRYLAKPLEPEKLREALTCSLRGRTGGKYVLLPSESGRRRICVSELCYVEAFERGTRFVLTDGMLVTRLKFTEAQTMLPPSFIQTHRAYLANPSHIRKIGPREFELTGGLKIPVSKYRYRQAAAQFSRYMTEG